MTENSVSGFRLVLITSESDFFPPFYTTARLTLYRHPYILMDDWVRGQMLDTIILVTTRGVGSGIIGSIKLYIMEVEIRGRLLVLYFF